MRRLPISGSAGTHRELPRDHRAVDPHNEHDTDYLPGPDAPARARRLPWAELFKRVFAEDLLRCPRCLNGSPLIIAFITDLAVVENILTHLGLPTDLPAPAPASHPAQLTWDRHAWDGSSHPHDRQQYACRAARAPPIEDPVL